MTLLSQKLERYYIRRGNRIVFPKNRSLNELAMEMWEQMDYRDIDSSILSKVINGKKMFTRKQLSVFCSIIHVPKKEKQILEAALIQDIASAKGFRQNDELYLLDQKEFFRSFLHTIATLRKSGQPETALELSQYIQPVSQDKCLVIDFYSERARLHGETSHTLKTIRHIKYLNEMCFEMGEKTSKKGVLDMSYVTYGGAYYLENDWNQSAQFLESKYPLVQNETKIEFLRTLLLNYAYLNDKTKFHQIFKKAVRVLEQHADVKNDFIASLLESMIRSLSVLRRTKEARKLSKYADFFEVSPFYRAQLLRGKAYLLAHEALSTKKPDRDEFREQTSDIFTDTYSAYQRHRKQVRKIGEDIELMYKTHTSDESFFLDFYKHI